MHVRRNPTPRALHGGTPTDLGLLPMWRPDMKDHRPSPRGVERAHLSPVNRTPSRRWFWRFMLVFGVALAIDFFVDDKLIFAGIALIWILACFFTLSKLRRPRHAP